MPISKKKKVVFIFMLTQCDYVALICRIIKKNIDDPNNIGGRKLLFVYFIFLY